MEISERLLKKQLVKLVQMFVCPWFPLAAAMP
jgi:hypothetical protein